MGSDISVIHTSKARLRYAFQATAGCWFAVLALAGLSGCGPHWVYTFVEAENLARPREKPIFVCYRDPFDPVSGRMFDILSTPEAGDLVKNMVCCTLVTEYDPNRRFMAQYGCNDAPAMVIIHPDGTYHSRPGPLDDMQQLRAFVESAKPPGQKPNVDIQIPRPSDWVVRAEGDYEVAVQKAKRQNRKMIVVYKWWLDASSTELLRRLLRPEVAARTTETINCVLDWDYIPNRAFVSRYGVTQFPAIIVVHQDGSHQAHNGLASTEEIARFLTRALTSSGSGGAGARSSVSSPTASGGYSWISDFQQARSQAQRSGKGLFIFYRSSLSDESSHMAQLLETPDVARLFSGVVQCRLDWSESRNRDLMMEFNVPRAPGFVVMRPDGAFSSRYGTVVQADLKQMRDFLDGR